LTKTDFSIGTKQTSQQDVKSNNVTQDGEQHNAAFKRQNHVKHKKKLDIRRNHLFRLKEKRKYK